MKPPIHLKPCPLRYVQPVRATSPRLFPLLCELALTWGAVAAAIYYLSKP